MSDRPVAGASRRAWIVYASELEATISELDMYASELEATIAQKDAWIEKAFEAHPNIDLDIAALLEKNDE